MSTDRVEKLFEVEFDLLIAKQKSEGLDLGDLRRLDLLTRSFKAYTSNPIKKEAEDDLSLYSDEVLKKILSHGNNNTKSEPEGAG
jgi:hypothetical protein